MVLFYAPAYCVLGHRKCFVRNHVAIIFFFKTENWCAARRVVNLKKKRHNGHAGTGWNTTKLRKQVAIFFFFETNSMVYMKRVVSRASQNRHAGTV